MTTARLSDAPLTPIEIRRFEALPWLAEQLLSIAARIYRNGVTTWLTTARVGHTSETRGGYTIVERGLGFVVVQMRDGTRRTVPAPIPLA